MKKPTLGSALRQAAGHQEPSEPAPQPTRHAARVGKVMVSAYMPPDVRSSIRLVQAQHPELTLQDILVEALNDLFAKYGVPQSARSD